MKDGILRQVDAFQKLTGRAPSHIDSHQHSHTREPARHVVLDLAASLRLPARSCDPRVSYCGRFYGQTDEGSPLPDLIGVEALLKLLAELPTGVTELGCHPGVPDPQFSEGSPWRERRELELRIVTDPELRSLIDHAGIRLITYREL